MENRFISVGNFEVRSIGDGDSKETHIQGYALTFDEMSYNLGGFKEIIKTGALDKCDINNVFLDFNHDNNLILARNNKADGIGSLVLKVDEKGLFFDGIPTHTSYAKDLIINMENGVLNKCSFVFNVDWNDPDAQEWKWNYNKEGYDIRIIKKISKISSVSIVSSPAYDSTNSTVYKRSKENHENGIELEKKLQKCRVFLNM